MIRRWLITDGLAPGSTRMARLVDGFQPSRRESYRLELGSPTAPGLAVRSAGDTTARIGSEEPVTIRIGGA